MVTGLTGLVTLRFDNEILLKYVNQREQIFWLWVACTLKVLPQSRFA